MKQRNYSPWVSTAIAIEKLGITKEHLYRHRAEWMVAGKHYRNIALPSSMRRTYRWHIGQIRVDWPLDQS